MTHVPLLRLAAVAVLVSPVLTLSARTAPVPNRPDLRLTPGGQITVPDLGVRALGVADETTVVVAVTKGPAEGVAPYQLGPNGAILDLGRKTRTPFTNGHKATISRVVVARGRVATTSVNASIAPQRDTTLRVWDLKAGKTTAVVEIEKPGDESSSDYHVTWLHKSDRVAVVADGGVLVFDPTKSDDRVEFACPPAPRRCLLSGPVRVNPDDSRLVCSTGSDNELIVWDVATRKATVIPDMVPPDAKRFEWSIRALAFGRNGELIACRSGSHDEVPEKSAEKDVPADRRGAIQVNLASGRLTTLGFGHTTHTDACTIDPTETWLVTVGLSRPDTPIPDKPWKTVGELRVYHLATKELVYREQVGENSLSRVSFTPGGKRIVAATYFGEVRWWDVPGK